MHITDFVSSLKSEWMAIPSLQNARSQLLRGMMVAFAILGFPAMLVGSFEAYVQGHPATSLQYLALYLPILFVAVRPRQLSFRWQSRILLGGLFALAFSTLLTYGFGGAGIHVLLTICVLTTMLLDGRAGMMSIGIALVVIVVAAYALTTGLIEIDPALLGISVSPVAWATAAATFLMLSVAIVVTVGLVQSFLQHSLQSVQDHRQRLQKSESQYRLLAETAHDLIITCDMDGMITYANSTALRLSGYSQEQVHSKSLTDLIPVELQQAARGNREQLLDGDHQRLIFETEFVAVAGHSVPVEVNASLIKDDQEVTGMLMIARDITERKRAEEELGEYRDHLEDVVAERTHELQSAQEKLLRQERLAVLGQLAGGVGHELRNPLGVISNAVYYLKMVSSGTDAPTQEYLELIDTEVKRAAKIVSDLLDFSHVRSSDRQSTRVSALTAATLESSSIPEGISVEIRVPHDLSPVWVDPLQITQVLNNLILNACQAMPEGGKLTLAARAKQDGIEISIDDTGTGIAPEHMDRLFEPLFTTKAKGIGLGLALSEKLIEANGGRIAVVSELGTGTVFTLHLPVCGDQL